MLHSIITLSVVAKENSQPVFHHLMSFQIIDFFVSLIKSDKVQNVQQAYQVESSRNFNIYPH
jgi:hypothetical protein